MVGGRANIPTGNIVAGNGAFVLRLGFIEDDQSTEWSHRSSVKVKDTKDCKGRFHLEVACIVDLFAAVIVSS